MKATGKFWEAKALSQGQTAQEILIYGDIGNWNEDPAISIDATALIDYISSIAPNLAIAARINSKGGDVVGCVAIANALMRHAGGCQTYNDGMVASAAGLIYMAGSKRFMADNALFMIHAPWAGFQGNSSQFRDAADQLDKYADMMATIYSRCGKPKENLKALVMDGKDHLFTADECLAMGFCTDKTEPLKITADYTFAPQGRTPTEDKPMPEPTPTPQANPPSPPVDVAAIQAKAKLDFHAGEKQRREDIRTAYAKFMPQEGVKTLLDTVLDNPDTDLVQARAKLLDHLGSQAEPLNPQGHNVRIEAGQTAREKKIQAFGNALRVKAGLENRDGQNPFMSYNLFDMARATAEESGLNVKGMDRLSVARAALSLRPMGAGLTTSDFPILLENVLHKSLLQGYTAAPSIWHMVCKIGSVSDFREWHRLRLGLIGGIEEVNEAGEYRYGEIPDASKESVSVKRRGKIIQVTPELIINDDLGGLTDIAVQMGAGAKRSIDRAFFTLLTDNPNLRDGKALFHADHGNLAGTAAYPSQTSLVAAKNAMKSQKDHSDEDFIETAPEIFLGPLGYDDDVNVINAAASTVVVVQGTATATPNNAFGLLKTILSSPRLTGTAWYIFANPLVNPAFECVFLDGQREPIITTEQDFDTSGTKHKVELPFGIAPIDPTGAHKNAGGVKA